MNFKNNRLCIGARINYSIISSEFDGNWPISITLLKCILSHQTTQSRGKPSKVDHKKTFCSIMEKDVCVHVLASPCKFVWACESVYELAQLHVIAGKCVQVYLHMITYDSKGLLMIVHIQILTKVDWSADFCTSLDIFVQVWENIAKIAVDKFSPSWIHGEKSKCSYLEQNWNFQTTVCSVNW